MLVRRGYHFGDMWDDMFRWNEEMSRFFGRRQRRARAGVYPHLNVYDDGESFVVRAEVPGLDPSGLEVHATADALTLKGEKRRAQVDNRASYHRQERGHGVFSRSLSLAQPIDPDKVQAHYKHGVLEVILPKAEAAKPRKIQVAAA